MIVEPFMMCGRAAFANVLTCAMVMAVASAARQHAEHFSMRKTDAGKAKEITHLPGLQTELRSRQFSGYININETNDKNLFFWLVTSEGQPKRDPVVLWLTGGPGCSSMDAFIYEHGPFKFQLDDYEGESSITLTENPYAWSKVATMIYVDSPVGAGLSFSKTPTDYKTNDARTIEDLYIFIKKFFDLFPEYKANNFYIAGESYGGAYVPLLAQRIYRGLKSEGAGTSINLKGYMTGNGVADDEFDGNGQVEFAFGMGLMDPDTHLQLSSLCGGNYWNATPGGACSKAINDAYDRFYWVNPYDILAPCFMSKAAAKAGQQGAHADGGRSEGAETSSRLYWPYRPVFDRSKSLPRRSTRLGHSVPCSDRRAALKWLSLPEVREAIHAESVEAVPWQPCSDILDYTVDRVAMIDVHKELIAAGLRALIYSGDHDFVVPFTGTRNWVYSLKLRTQRPYTPWTIKQQVAGFAVQFEPDFTYATVKGGGHMVPQSHPLEALELVSRWLVEEL
mmetsp:Transcript_26433/g.57660  ORF Transcript_26433/g.57660 Transcript_26433/m.57660 type:complete len:507 (+) Transcript_26433:49-1569(+)